MGGAKTVKHAPSGVVLYNPAFLKPEELKALFLVRHADLAELEKLLQDAGRSPQHALILGDRGFGKSTLLNRLAHRVGESVDLERDWFPICFDEEQYNVGQLSDLWVNALERAVETSKDPWLLAAFAKFQSEIWAQLTKEADRESAREAAARSLLHDLSVRLNRRLVLLVDNFDLVLERLDPKTDGRSLRALLQKADWFLLVGASSRPIKATVDHASPFYELFQILELAPLNHDETRALLKGLGRLFGKEAAIATLLTSRQALFRAVLALLAGNLRTLTIFFTVLIEYPEAELGFLLERVFDRHSGFYKDLIEELPPQGQRVVDALARQWDPASADSIADELRLERGAASSQLHRLVEKGLAQKSEYAAEQGAQQSARGRLTFELRDRFFNLWFLIRSGRQQRLRLRDLIWFVEVLSHVEVQLDPTESLLETLKVSQLLSHTELARQRALASEFLLRANQEAQQGHQISLDLAPFESPLTYLLAGQQELASRQAQSWRRLGRDGALTLLLLTHFEERAGHFEAALEALALGMTTPQRCFFLAEQARMSIHYKRWAEAQQALAQLILPAKPDEVRLPARWLAELAVVASQAGTEALTWQVVPLLEVALLAEPEDLGVALVACDLEVTLSRPDRLLARLRSALQLARTKSFENEPARLLATLLRAATLADPKTLNNLLSEVGLAERWFPLAHALTYFASGSDPQALRRIAPEIQKITELVLERIETYRSGLPSRSGRA